jgi:flagellar basal-body rod protein FlgC
MMRALYTAASGMQAQQYNIDTITNNLANVNTTRTPEGGAFKRQLVVFSQKQETNPDASMNPMDADAADPGKSHSGVEAVGIMNDPGPDRMVYDPTHPDADQNGYVHMPNVDAVKEMVDMIAASRAYQANVTAIQEARSMGGAALGLLKA